MIIFKSILTTFDVSGFFEAAGAVLKMSLSLKYFLFKKLDEKMFHYL